MILIVTKRIQLWTNEKAWLHTELIHRLCWVEWQYTELINWSLCAVVYYWMKKGMRTSFEIISEEVPDRTSWPWFGSRPENWDFEEWTKSENWINPVPAWSKYHRRKMGRTKDTSRYEETMCKLYEIQWAFDAGLVGYSSVDLCLVQITRKL